MSFSPESYVGTWPMRGRIFIPLFDHADELRQRPVRWSELAALAGWPGGISAIASLGRLLDDIRTREGDAYEGLRLPSTLEFMRDVLIAWNSGLIPAQPSLNGTTPRSHIFARNFKSMTDWIFGLQTSTGPYYRDQVLL